MMLDLALLARRLRGAGRAMYVRGAQPHIRRLIEMMGLHRLPGVIVEGGPAAAHA